MSIVTPASWMERLRKLSPMPANWKPMACTVWTCSRIDTTARQLTCSSRSSRRRKSRLCRRAVLRPLNGSTKCGGRAPGASRLAPPSSIRSLWHRAPLKRMCWQSVVGWGNNKLGRRSFYEEFVQGPEGRFGCFFGEIMAAFHGFAAYIICPVTPDGKDIVPFLDQSLLAPQHEKGTLNPLYSAVCLIQLVVNRGSGAVVLAHRVDR